MTSKKILKIDINNYINEKPSTFLINKKTIKYIKTEVSRTYRPRTLKWMLNSRLCEGELSCPRVLKEKIVEVKN